MSATGLPPAGWYRDPEVANFERYWSGTAWSDQRRPRPAPSPAPVAPPAAVAVPMGPGTAPSEGAPTPPQKKHWHLTQPPLEEVVEDLRSPDTATRIAAAAQLRFYRRHKYAERRLELEIACLRDPVPAVRYYALAAIANFKPDRQWIVSLLVSDKEADAATRASVIAGIEGIGGPDSPFPDWAKKSMPKLFHGVVLTALHRADSAATVRPALQLARTVGITPLLFAPWGDGTSATLVWPSRCCVCGRPDPGRTERFEFHREWTDTASTSNYEIVTTRTEASGVLTVPVCIGCTPPAPPRVGPTGLTMEFASSEFVAELLYHGTWSLL